jgi:TetR/AcrR family transcriptional regulator
LREAQIRENLKTTISPTILTNLLLASVEGRLVQFVRSEFKVSPLDNWNTQWDFLSKNLLEPYSTTAKIETTV